MEEEEVGKTRSRSKQPPKTHWFCKSCLNDFWGAKKKDNARCPRCGAEGLDLMELTEEGLPASMVRKLMEDSREVPPVHVMNPGAEEEKPPNLNLNLTRDTIAEMDQVSADMFRRELDESLKEHLTAGAKVKALESRRKLMEEQRKIKALESNEGMEGQMPPSPGLNYPQQTPSPAGVGMLMHEIGGLPEEQREWWLEKMKDQTFVMGLATLLNPPKQTIQAYNPYYNPIAQVQSMLQQGPQQGQQQPQEEAPTDNMKDMAETIKIMFETVKEMMPQHEEGVNSELKDVLREIKDGQAELRDKYYSLQLAQLEGRGGGESGAISKEDLEEIIEKKISNLKKEPKEALKDIKDTMLAMDELRQTMKGEAPEQKEPLDEWIKKFTMERKAEEDKLRHEREIRELEAKAAKWSTAKTLLQDGIRANMMRMSEPEKRKEEEESIEPEMQRKKVQLVK